MTYFSVRNNSYAASVGFHILLVILFYFIKLSIEYSPREYLELGFGGFGSGNPSGGKGTELGPIQESTTAEKTKNINQEVKEVVLAKSKNTEDENVITQPDKNKEKDKSENISEKNSETNKPSKTSSKAIGAGGEGPAGFGYDIDFGGKGIRKIYSFMLPKYPEGVSKEIDVKLKFTILPDGTVGNIIPLIKSDSRLENTAINSLRQWRFEPLPASKKQFDQTAVIVFPYRLK
ncbi:MAG: TonB family protein [Ignavibacteriales bacterium]|nr:TonB family protein [Ignavibacteriales bacterium]